MGLIPLLRCTRRITQPDQPPSAPARLSPTSTRRRRLLLPREHGAYAEIGFPLLTVLLLGRPGIEALMLSIAVLCAFLLHEPALVLLGHRGTRIQRESGAAAVRLGVLLALAVLGFGVAGLWLSPPAVRWGVVVALILGVALLPMTAMRREKTLAGELLAAAALVSACVPVALAASVPTATTVMVAVVWGATFGLGTLAVRVTVLGAKGEAQRLWIVTLLCASCALLGALWVATIPELPGGKAVIALVPGSIATLGLLMLRIPPRRLRIVGWTIAASNVMTLAVLLLV